MFAKKNVTTPDPIDLAITQALSDMQSLTVESPEYTKALANLSALNKLKEHNAPKQISPDVLVTAGANLAGILLILHYERIHVMASKAVGFVMKLK